MKAVGANGRRLFILLAVTVTIIAFFGLDLHLFLTLDIFKAHQAELAAAFESRPLLIAGGFLLLQILALTLSLPGSVLTLSVAAGAIFGLGWGLLLAITAITIGDSLAFLVARYVLRDWVEKRFERSVRAINRGVERDGAFYLLSLRLMALVPFFIVNLGMGLTRIPLRIFAPVSLAGLLPATILYVNAGTAIARLDSPSDVYSARMIVAFLLLGLTPVASRYVFRRRCRSAVPHA